MERDKQPNKSLRFERFRKYDTTWEVVSPRKSTHKVRYYRSYENNESLKIGDVLQENELEVIKY